MSYLIKVWIFVVYVIMNKVWKQLVYIFNKSKIFDKTI